MVPSASLDRARARGHLCLVTYHPEWLPATAVRDADVLITVEGIGRARIRTGAKSSVCFSPSPRELSHVRHQSKYAEEQVPYERGFTFRDASGAVGTHVSSLAEFATQLERVPRTALSHHAAHRDFSRWIRDVFQDQILAAAVRRAEETFRPEDREAFCAAVQQIVALRYDLEGQQDRIA